MAHDVIRAGRAAAGTKDIRCTVSIGAFVPKPHTPFQWAAQADAGGRRRAGCGCCGRRSTPTGRSAGPSASATTTGSRRMIEGLLSRGDRRVAAVIRRVWGDGGRFDGWSEHFSYERWMAAATGGRRVDVDWYTTRERGENEVLPWDHLDSGLDKEWLWADWQDALSEDEQDDCRWTPCFDCGVCPGMGTEIQIGPTGQTLLPMPTVRPALASSG